MGACKYKDKVYQADVYWENNTCTSCVLMALSIHVRIKRCAIAAAVSLHCIVRYTFVMQTPWIRYRNVTHTPRTSQA